MPKFRNHELVQIERAYAAGRVLADAGALEDAIGQFDNVLHYLPRRRRDRVYRIRQDAGTQPRQGIHWLPPVLRDALLAKAYCLNELGRAEEAFTLLERAVEIDPHNPQVFAELGYTYGAHDEPEMARIAFTTAADLDRGNPSHLRALAHLALVAEDYPQASGYARRALELDPSSVPTLHQLAFAEYRQGEISAAILTLEQALALQPQNRETVLRLAGTLREAGRLREAISRVDACLREDPQEPELLGLMGDLLLQDGKAPELLPHVQRLLARNSRDPHAFELLAWGFFQQGRLREALQAMKKLVLLEPMQPQHYFKQGMLSQDLGDWRQAMFSFLHALRLGEGAEIAEMAGEAINTLDQMQLEQLLARAAIDPQFHQQLQRAPELTLHQAGYLLSPHGQQMLLSVDFSNRPPMPPASRMMH